jgi:hypothetical protein
MKKKARNISIFANRYLNRILEDFIVLIIIIIMILFSNLNSFLFTNSTPFTSSYYSILFSQTCQMDCSAEKQLIVKHKVEIVVERDKL